MGDSTHGEYAKSELDGKAAASVLYIAKDDAAVAALSEFFEKKHNSWIFMKAKRETEGLKTAKSVKYLKTWSEWEGRAKAEIVAGNRPLPTGRTIFHLFETL